MRELYRARYRRDAMPNAKPLLLLVAMLVLAACGGPAPTPGPSPASDPAPTPVAPEPTAVPGSSTEAQAGVLVTYETRGGECPGGPCGMKAVISRDGTVETSDGMSTRLDDQAVERLVDAIEQADWEAILGTPFTGECPVNVDGQEQIYTFTVQGEAVTVASCTVEVDSTAEPFLTVQLILFGGPQ